MIDYDNIAERLKAIEGELFEAVVCSEDQGTKDMLEAARARTAGAMVAVEAAGAFAEAPRQKAFTLSVPLVGNVEVTVMAATEREAVAKLGRLEATDIGKLVGNDELIASLQVDTTGVSVL